MPKISLASLRQQIKEKTPGGGGSKIWTPPEHLQLGGSAKIRLVLAIDPISGSFWTIQKSIPLQFVSPDDDTKHWNFRVPCLEMYEPADSSVKCPVANEVRNLFNEVKTIKDSGQDKEAAEALNNIALAHWIKYSYLFQGFILEGGGEDVDPAVNVPIRFPKSMFTLINQSIMSADSGFDTLPTGEYEFAHLEHVVNGTMPDDMTDEEFVKLFNGRNYIARKTKKGEHFNYETSGWDMKETSLTDDQIAHLVKENYLDLRKYLPKRPTDEQYEVFVEMIRTSIAYARGEGDGLWNYEWEEHGIKPNKGKDSDSDDGDGGNKGGGNLKASLASRLKGGSTPTGADGVRNKLQAARGVAAGAKPAEEATPEEAPEHPASSPASSATNQVSSLAERLKAKKAAAGN